MEAEWIAKRAALRWLLRTHPEWTQKEYAAFLHCSVGWVKSGKSGSGKLRQMISRSYTPAHVAFRTPFPAPHPAVVERIVQIQQAPPENLQRVPGSRTILYYLHRDSDEAAPKDSMCRVLLA